MNLSQISQISIIYDALFSPANSSEPTLAATFGTSWQGSTCTVAAWSFNCPLVRKIGKTYRILSIFIDKFTSLIHHASFFVLLCKTSIRIHKWIEWATNEQWNNEWIDEQFNACIVDCLHLCACRVCAWSAEMERMLIQWRKTDMNDDVRMKSKSDVREWKQMEWEYKYELNACR